MGLEVGVGLGVHHLAASALAAPQQGEDGSPSSLGSLSQEFFVPNGPGVSVALLCGLLHTAAL